MLTLANLIALSGLLINSAPVIIGAMLISPLMGPMLSFGFSFITGDKVIWNKSLKKLIISVVVSVVIAGIATYLSPLTEITNEILSRTTPNLYDLLIAFLAGTAGAAAICTKKGYLTVVPGVAIATAVIPPLSVTGFGIGIGNIYVASGGFFLFFTNFVAIVITSCSVFYFYGFRPILTNNLDKEQLKKRIIFLALVLFLISIPLIYTLAQTISEVKLKQDIQTILKKSFDRDEFSRLSTFSYYKQEDGTLEINAVVDTVNYLKDADVMPAEKILSDSLKRNVRFNLDQVKVLRGGLKKEISKPSLPKIIPPVPAQDLVKRSREDLLAAIRPSIAKVEMMLSPSRVIDFSMGYHDKGQQVTVLLKVKRDVSISAEETLWLQKVFSSDLKAPVSLSIETVPFIQPQIFHAGEANISDSMKQSVVILKDIYGRNNEINILVESGAESAFPYHKRIALARKRADIMAEFLISDCNIPSAKIRIRILPAAVKKPFVKISVLTTAPS
ncbi:MAG: TIGR00341 family protein [Syntrophaceae bacterium]|nr:TIGR00341 family protein [Syntrophaceae bacterium]